MEAEQPTNRLDLVHRVVPEQHRSPVSRRELVSDVTSE